MPDRCACPSFDAVDCVRIRYRVSDEDAHNDPCGCACHEDLDDSCSGCGADWGSPCAPDCDDFPIGEFTPTVDAEPKCGGCGSRLGEPCAEDCIPF